MDTVRRQNPGLSWIAGKVPGIASPKDEAGMGLDLPRPGSPTLKTLFERSLVEERTGISNGPYLPAGTMGMNRDQTEASRLFKKNMEEADPSGEKRKVGEFGQAFGRKENRLEPTTPLCYQEGGAVGLPADLPEHTTYIIHSHLGGPENRANNFPSDGDYHVAYLASRGHTNGIKGEMMYHPGEDRFYGYEGRIDPELGTPVFHRLKQPTSRTASPFRVPGETGAGAGQVSAEGRRPEPSRRP